VDWCDAYAYCKWAGKHLCGKIGGGTNGFSDYATATLSEWFNACSAGGAQKYPYGNAYDGTACVDSDYDGTLGFSAVSDVLRPVGTATRCHGTISPFDAIYDLSGNVWEWDDSCNGVTGSGDYCYERGGSFPNGTGQPSSGVLDLACDYGGLQNRSSFSFNAGFRCCAASL
jgi:formylglycine-generating enzyme required for sulfatase activity